MLSLCKLSLDRHRFRSYRSPRAVLPPFAWSADPVGLPRKDCHSKVLSGSLSTKIPYQMKAEGSWEKDGRSAVSTWEKGGKAGRPALGYEKWVLT